jgi:hypothetical protein
VSSEPSGHRRDEGEGPGSEDPTTEELRLSQLRREASEREQAEEDPTEEGTGQHERRAEKAEYLKRKLEDRADAERRE